MPIPPSDATQRFSARVENYVRYRPGYPPQVIERLRQECGLQPDSIVADIASGTGLFTRLLLENGNRVFAVEPNLEMRQAGEQALSSFCGLISVNGTAEATTLAAQSLDIVTSAQAAHWFDRVRARVEFARILKPRGWCVLLWNERQTDTTPFLRDYERLLLQYSTDYEHVRHERTTETIGGFFAPSPHRERVFALTQQFDCLALEGRLLSSSYAPLLGHPNYEAMLSDLRRTFGRHQQNGIVEFIYNTRVFYGPLD